MHCCISAIRKNWMTYFQLGAQKEWEEGWAAHIHLVGRGSETEYWLPAKIDQCSYCGIDRCLSLTCKNSVYEYLTAASFQSCPDRDATIPEWVSQQLFLHLLSL